MNFGRGVIKVSQDKFSLKAVFLVSVLLRVSTGFLLLLEIEIILLCRNLWNLIKNYFPKLGLAIERMYRLW